MCLLDLILFPSSPAVPTLTDSDPRAQFAPPVTLPQTLIRASLTRQSLSPSHPPSTRCPLAEFEAQSLYSKLSTQSSLVEACWNIIVHSGT